VGKQKIPPPVSWKININTVPKEVIMALCDEMTEELADNIISHRVSQDEEGNYRYFKKISDIKSVEGMTDEIYNKIKGLLTTKSMYFEIRAKSKIGTLIKNWVFVVCRDPVSGAIFRLTSHQLNDFFYYKPEQ
jgi:type II secretory pathway component PulK